jgi:flagellin-like protein
VLPELIARNGVSPLGTALLAVVITVVGAAAAGGVIAALCLGLCGWLAVGMAQELAVGPLAGWFAVTVVATSPAFVLGVGTESHLAAALLFGLALAAFREQVIVTGVLAGLLVLVRPELAIAAVPLIGVLVVHGMRGIPARDLLVTIGVATVVALPWWAWLWWSARVEPAASLARPRPDVLASLGDLWSLDPVVTIALLVPLVVGVVVMRGAEDLGRPWSRTAVLAACGAIFYLCALVLLDMPGTPAAYAPAVALAALAAALTAGNFLFDRAVLVPTALVLGLALVVALATGPITWPRGVG